MKTLIVDDHPLFREGLAAVLTAIPACGEILFAADAIEAIDSLQQQPDIGLVMLDINMPRMKGSRAIPLLKRVCPRVQIIVVSANDSHLDIGEVIAAGACTHLSKSAKSIEIRRTIESVLRGEATNVRYASNGVEQNYNVKVMADALTPKQQEVLIALCEGLTNKAIADKLDISVNTVKVHISAVFEALNVKTRTQAVVEFRARGLQS